MLLCPPFFFWFRRCRRFRLTIVFLGRASGWVERKMGLPQHENFSAQQDYEQIFHRSMDPYDEFDLLHRNLSTAVQPTDDIYKSLKARYHTLKNLAQSGARV